MAPIRGSHQVFTIHYAYMYYDRQNSQCGPGLQFPNTNQPSFWDFAYFSFAVGMTFGTTDVAVVQTRFRTTVLRHGLLAFLFNTAILALTVSFLGVYFGS